MTMTKTFRLVVIGIFLVVIGLLTVNILFSLPSVTCCASPAERELRAAPYGDGWSAPAAWKTVRYEFSASGPSIGDLSSSAGLERDLVSNEHPRELDVALRASLPPGARMAEVQSPGASAPELWGATIICGPASFFVMISYYDIGDPNAPPLLVTKPAQAARAQGFRYLTTTSVSSGRSAFCD